MLDAFLRHRREVVTRRTIYDLAQGARARPHPRRPGGCAREHRRGHRAHQGGAVAPAEARVALQARAWPPGVVPQLLERAGAISTRPTGLGASSACSSDTNGGGYHLSEAQAQAILDMRLHRLTGLEQDKIIAEYKELLERIARSGRYSRAARAAHAGDPRRADRGARAVSATRAAPRSIATTSTSAPRT